MPPHPVLAGLGHPSPSLMERDVGEKTKKGRREFEFPPSYTNSN